MEARAKGTFKISEWNEQSLDEREGTCKLTQASVTKTFEGDIEGMGTLEYLMVYHDQNRADFVGMEKIVGKVGNRTGSFVLQHTGYFENGIANVQFTVVPGSATGELAGMIGCGGFESGHADLYEMELIYEL